MIFLAPGILKFWVMIRVLITSRGQVRKAAMMAAMAPLTAAEATESSLR